MFGKEKFKINTLTTYKNLLFMVIVIISILVNFIYALFQFEDSRCFENLAEFWLAYSNSE